MARIGRLVRWIRRRFPVVGKGFGLAGPESLRGGGVFMDLARGRGRGYNIRMGGRGPLG